MKQNVRKFDYAPRDQDHHIPYEEQSNLSYAGTGQKRYDWQNPIGGQPSIQDVRSQYSEQQMGSHLQSKRRLSPPTQDSHYHVRGLIGPQPTLSRPDYTQVSAVNNNYTMNPPVSMSEEKSQSQGWASSFARSYRNPNHAGTNTGSFLQ